MSSVTSPAWEFGDHRLTVLPGISWEEWVVAWQTAERLQKSSAFYVGDALVAGSREFGERFSQVVDPKYIFQQRGPMWVCERIEPARRRPGLSYSLHKELAALEPEAQDRWLDRAAAGSWTVRDLREAMAAEARPGNGGPPLNEDDDTAIEEACSTWNEPDTEPVEPDTFGEVEDVAGEPLQAPPAHEGPPPPPDTASPGPAPAAAPEIATLRQCIADLRALAPKLLRTPVDNIVRLEDRITDALGLEPGEMSLLNTEVILKQLPPGWSYAVTLTKPGEQIAVGLGPSLACAVVEAILSAKLSDMGAG